MGSFPACLVMLSGLLGASSCGGGSPPSAGIFRACSADLPAPKWSSLGAGQMVWATVWLAAAVPSSSAPGAGGLMPLAAPKTEPEILSRIPPPPPPPALLAAAIPDRPPTGGAYQPVRLADLLARPAPRSQQKDLIMRYWELAVAVATLQFRQQELDWLQSLRVFPADQQAYQTVLGEARAARQAAEAALTKAQQSLVQKAGWDPKTPPPWPVDKPHLGNYSTMLNALFSGGAIPRNLLLIDKCLPYWRVAILRRTQAVWAAEDALQAFHQAYQQGRCDLRPLLWIYQRWTEQHTLFLQDTLAYNGQIAEFALAAAPPGAYGPSLVRMLILVGDTQRRGSSSSVPGASQTPGGRLPPEAKTPPGVVPATYLEDPIRGAVPQEVLEPIPSGRPEPPTIGFKQEPTPAPPRSFPEGPGEAPLQSVPFGGGREPTLAPPKPSPKPPSSPSLSTPSVIRPLVPLVPERLSPTLQEATQGDLGGTVPPAPPPSSGENRPPHTEGGSTGQKPIVQQAKRPTELSPSWTEETIALYPGLVQADPPVQVGQLALSFHGPTQPKENLRQQKLLACLQRVSSGKRRELLEAYWVLWQQWAQTASLEQHKANLEKLGSLLLQRLSRPLGAEERLLWRVLLLAEEAEQMETQIRLLEHQEKFAQILGLPAGGNWMPGTLPYTGPYNLRLETLDKNVRTSWAVRRSAEMVSSLYDLLLERAKAVVQADQTRTELVQQYRQGQRPLHEVLAACQQQKQATFDFLQTLTDYNQAIADYVVLVVPADLPAEEFLRTLVKEP